MFPRFKWLVGVSSFLNNPLFKIGVNAASTLVLGRVVDATPIDFLLSNFFLHEDVSAVLQLSFSFLTQHVFDLRS